MTLPMRRFRVLLSQLPADSRVRAQLAEVGAGISELDRAVAAFDRKQGRNVNRTVVDFDTFIGRVKGD